MLAGVTGTLTSLALIVVFVTIGGFFSGSELAVLTLRESQVERLPGRGGERVRRLRADSSRFLASVQVGVTFAGFFASAYGGSTLSEPLGSVLARWVPEGELRDMVSTHCELGAEERRVLTDVFGAADRQLNGVMVPRTEVEFLAA